MPNPPQNGAQGRWCSEHVGSPSKVSASAPAACAPSPPSVAGVLSALNLGKPHTQVAQFFICLAPCPHFDGRYSAFGQVVEGLEVLRALGDCGSPGGRPTQRVLIAGCGLRFPEG